MKGYIPCSILVELERRTGRRCHEMFDMFAGTSIGGILACLLASGSSAGAALEFFTEDGPVIFGKTQLMGWKGVLRPRYAAKPIEDCLQNRLGGARLTSLNKALLVPAFDLKAYDPYFFKTPLIDEDFPLWSVGRATSAAQSYFPAYALGEMIFWDGGNVANNPAACAVAEAARIWPGEQVRILSLSCGQTKSVYKPSDLINAGLTKIGVETMSLLFDANDELSDYVLRHLMPDHYFRISPELWYPLPIDGASDADLLNLKSAAFTCLREFSGTLDKFVASL